MVLRQEGTTNRMGNPSRSGGAGESARPYGRRMSELRALLAVEGGACTSTAVQRMLEQGLITETEERPAPELDDERRRYYRLTPFGKAVARAEAPGPAAAWGGHFRFR